MKEGLIPRRYAKALYKYAQEHQCTQQVYTDAQRIEEVFATHPTLSRSNCSLWPQAMRLIRQSFAS